MSKHGFFHLKTEQKVTSQIYLTESLIVSHQQNRSEYKTLQKSRCNCATETECADTSFEYQPLVKSSISPDKNQLKRLNCIPHRNNKCRSTNLHSTNIPLVISCHVALSLTEEFVVTMRWCVTEKKFLHYFFPHN